MRVEWGASVDWWGVYAWCCCIVLSEQYSSRRWLNPSCVDSVMMIAIGVSPHLQFRKALTIEPSIWYARRTMVYLIVNNDVESVAKVFVNFHLRDAFSWPKTDNGSRTPITIKMWYEGGNLSEIMRKGLRILIGHSITTLGKARNDIAHIAQ